MVREGILENEPGITEKKGIWFYEPSDFAKQNLLYPMWGGEYVCTYPYRVERDYLDAFMLFSILEGELHYIYEGQKFTAHEGQVVFLDCHRPNCYWAEKPLRKRWLHFNGANAAAYHDLIYSQYGPCLSNRTVASSAIYDILTDLELGITDDHRMSLLLYQILGDLATSRTAVRQNEMIQPAVSYIAGHYHEDLTVEKLAELCNVSAVYLTRLFQQELHRAPHEYLQKVRLNEACRLLSETEHSVESIAEQCGFSSSTHFIRMFRKRYGLTPKKFRNLF